MKAVRYHELITDQKKALFRYIISFSLTLSPPLPLPPSPPHSHILIRSHTNTRGQT